MTAKKMQTREHILRQALALASQVGVAGPAEIEEAHGIVRKYLKEFLPAESREIRILYGGSVKGDNAAEIKKLDNVDGLLVGGASLKAKTFMEIIKA